MSLFHQDLTGKTSTWRGFPKSLILSFVSYMENLIGGIYQEVRVVLIFGDIRTQFSRKIPFVFSAWGSKWRSLNSQKVHRNLFFFWVNSQGRNFDRPNMWNKATSKVSFQSSSSRPSKPLVRFLPQSLSPHRPDMPRKTKCNDYVSESQFTPPKTTQGSPSFKWQNILHTGRFIFFSSAPMH